MARAVCHGVVIAESKDTVIVEGNHYFPPASVHREHLRDSQTTSVCGWKGTANYYHVEVPDHVCPDAAWYYAQPKPEAENIAGYIAFWKEVTVED